MEPWVKQLFCPQNPGPQLLLQTAIGSPAALTSCPRGACVPRMVLGLTCILVNSHSQPSRQDYCYHLHFADEENEAQQTSMLCPITQLVCGGAETKARPTQAFHLSQPPGSTRHLCTPGSPVPDPREHEAVPTTSRCLLSLNCIFQRLSSLRPQGPQVMSSKEALIGGPTPRHFKLPAAVWPLWAPHMFTGKSLSIYNKVDGA